MCKTVQCAKLYDIRALHNNAVCIIFHVAWFFTFIGRSAPTSLFMIRRTACKERWKLFESKISIWFLPPLLAPMCTHVPNFFACYAKFTFHDQFHAVLISCSQIMTNSPATSPVPSKPWFRGVKYSDNFLHQLFCSDRSFLHSAVPPHCRSSVTLDPWSQCNFGPSYWGGRWSC